MPAKGYRKADPALVVRFVRQAKSTGEIAALLQVSDTTIRAIRAAHGISAETGSPPTIEPWRVKCAGCSHWFWTKRKGQKYHRRACQLGHGMNWKLPKDGRTRRALLMRLYWKERKTSIEIAQRLGMSHKGILSAMRALKIARRRMGPKAVAHCIEAGCTSPVYRIMQKTNGSWYGRRCYLHWVVYRFNVNQAKGEYASWQRRNRRLLSRARSLIHAVSSTLSAGSKPASTSQT